MRLNERALCLDELALRLDERALRLNELALRLDELALRLDERALCLARPAQTRLPHPATFLDPTARNRESRYCTSRVQNAPPSAGEIASSDLALPVSLEQNDHAVNPIDEETQETNDKHKAPEQPSAASRASLTTEDVQELDYAHQDRGEHLTGTRSGCERPTHPITKAGEKSCICCNTEPCRCEQVFMENGPGKPQQGGRSEGLEAPHIKYVLEDKEKRGKHRRQLDIRNDLQQGRRDSNGKGKSEEEETQQKETPEEKTREVDTREKKSREKKSREKKPGEKEPGEKEPGGQKPGEQKPGEQKPGEKKAKEKKARKKTPIFTSAQHLHKHR